MVKKKKKTIMNSIFFDYCTSLHSPIKMLVIIEQTRSQKTAPKLIPIQHIIIQYFFLTLD